jgi:hypothetical protein
MRRRRDRTRTRTRRLAAMAGVATLALVTAEVAHVWRRNRTPPPSSARELVRGGELAARDTVDVLRAGYRSGSADETAVLNLFLAFGLTFAAARAVTHSIRRGSGLFRNVRIGRRHIHHFVPGIALALGAGGASIALRSEGVDRWLALPFGTGAALIIDETALLIELEDVYWSKEGVVSIDVGFGATTALAILALVIRLVRRGEGLVLAPHPARPGGTATSDGSAGCGPSRRTRSSRAG